MKMCAACGIATFRGCAAFLTTETKQKKTGARH